VLGRVALGISDESNYFFSAQYIDDLSDMLQYISQRMLFPLPQVIWSHTPKYQYELKAAKAAERFRECANEVIASGRQDNFVGHLLKAVDNNKFTLDEVISNVLVVAMAGTDPVAVGLCWAMYFLSQDPAVVKDIRQEINSLDASLSPSDRYNGLKLCQACYMEAIRLRGPAFHIDLQAIDKSCPITLASGTVIRPYDNILIPLEAIKTNPTVFARPNEFDPYRWFEQDKAKLALMQQHCPTFGHGPRICPGYEVAPAMGTLALASIVDHFDIELACPCDEIYRIVAFTVTMNKMPFKLTPVKK
jgi:cytochrome P450